MVEGRGATDARVDRHAERTDPSPSSFTRLVVAFVLAPLLVVCLVAFTPENTLDTADHRASRCAGSRRFSLIRISSQSFWNSLLARHCVGDARHAALAVPAGLAITRYDFPGAMPERLFLSPLIIPHLVLGVALLRLFALIGATGSFAWLVVAHA